MPQCLISFGANIGNPAETIQQAVALLRERLTQSKQPLRVSRLFRTPPVGGPSGQPPFLNAVAVADVDGSAWDAWHAIREVEHILGRQRQERWEARRIDLDILLFEQERIWTPHFKVPHPRMCMRRFILEPALDVARDWIDPVSGWSIQELANNLRQGPASLLIIANRAVHARQLVERAAESAGAQWTHQLSPNAQAPAAGRWLALVDEESLKPSLASSVPLPAAKLTVCLVPPVPIQGAAWEDYHRDKAIELQLIANDKQQESLRVDVGNQDPYQAMRSIPVPTKPTWRLSGPRYLLTTDDRDWAVHELIAACEAMDCPIEPINA